MTEVNNEFTREAANIITHQRDLILFDMLARGLTLTHRPFDAVEISRAALDPAKTPLLWLMMEKQCNAATQQKLVDYVWAGGKLILAGRMCVEAFDHTPCTILRDALGVAAMEDAAPFLWENIDALGYKDIPVSFVETFTGQFDEVLATRQQGGGVVGFFKKLGRGEALIFGATLPANTLDDVDVVNGMALKMGCEPLFTMSEWADVRISRSEMGSFLFVNNYQDDPLETVISYEGKPLFDGHPVKLPARRGAILPLEWRVNENLTIHYSTGEVTRIAKDGASTVIETDPAECSIKPD